MADMHCQSSSFIPVPNDKMELASKIVKTEQRESERYDDYCIPEVEITPDGVWIYNKEWDFDPYGAHLLVKKLVEELDLPGIHVVMWSISCSKPRIDHFGGSAFAVRKGYDTVWIDAGDEAKKQASLLK
jgi:hypothetical protein